MSDERQVSTIDPSEADPQSFSTLTVGLVGLFIIAALVLFLEFIYKSTYQAELRRKVIAEQPLELRDAQSQQREQLMGYRWVDEKAGVVTIPIERAMDLIVEEAAGREAEALSPR